MAKDQKKPVKTTMASTEQVHHTLEQLAKEGEKVGDVASRLVLERLEELQRDGQVPELPRTR